jgi:FeS assembly protein IscX
MPKPLQWTDVTDIGILLAETHPAMDPLSVRFTDLHAMVLALPGFAGDPKKSGEKILEAIQMAWLDEIED